MAIAEITAKPWEANDSERIAKFRKGIVGKTSDVWTSKPDLAACPKGDYRDWHIEDGTNYQRQLFCKFWETWVNPSGFSCEICKGHEILDWQSSHMREAFAGLVAAKGKEAAGELLVSAVRAKRLGQITALELADEFELE